MVDLQVFKKDSKDYLITVKDSAGTAIDITDYTFWMTVKSDPTDDDSEALILKEVIVHTAPLSGQTTISLASSDTDIDVSSATNRYVYDIRMKDTSEKVTTILNGVFNVKQPVTHDV